MYVPEPRLSYIDHEISVRDVEAAYFLLEDNLFERCGTNQCMRRHKILEMTRIRYASENFD